MNRGIDRGTPRAARSLILAAALGLGGAAGASAAPRVLVELKSGERIAAEVDGRTSSERLWLRLAAGNAEILRPIDWNHVARARVGADDLEPAAFRTKALEMRSLYEPPAAKPPVERRGRPPLAPWPLDRVESIGADARLANWDAGGEPDGLLLRLVPLNGLGIPTPAAGTMEAELWDNRSRYPRRLGRWQCAVAPPDAAAAGQILGLVALPGFIYRLPFQADHPQHDATIGRTGTLRVTLAVPGQGVFEYRVTNVPLRP